MKKLFKILAINFTVLLFLLLIMEIIFRLLGFGFGFMPFEMDPVYKHVHPKNFEFTIYDVNKEFGPHKIIYDGNGRRVESENYIYNESLSDVWFLGDSFTETKEVPWKNSYVGIIQNKSSINAINYGTMGYSPLLYYIQLKNELTVANKKMPQKVFIQLYGNDITDEESYSKLTSFDFKDRPIACNGGEPSSMKKLLRKSYVMRVARRAQMTLKFLAENQSDDQVKEVDQHLESNFNWDQNHRFSKSIHQIETLLDSLKVEHYFFAIPSKYSCLSGDWDSPMFATKFNNMAIKDSLPFINMNPIFKSDALESREMFFKKDIHCNAYGNQLIADELLKFIKN